MTADLRARRRILTALDENLFVEAGAGTGKTTQLVGRIVSLLVQGRARIENIAAITFTEAAAGELRDRVSEALERVAGNLVGDGDPIAEVLQTLDDGERVRALVLAREALEEIDRAAITTLHGFARRILAEHTLDAGLPPGFEVVDQISSELDFDRAWRDFSGLLVDDADASPHLERALVCGVSLKELHGLAHQLNQSWDLLAEAPLSGDLGDGAPPGPVPIDIVLDPLDRALAATAACSDPEDKLLAHILGLSGLRDRLASAPGDIEKLMLLADAPTMTCGRGQKGNWSIPVDDVREMVKAASEARETVLSRIASESLEHLTGVLRDFVMGLVEMRRSEGRLQYHDLLVHARNLVRSNQDVRAALHERYRFLLIDEFQDTDPIQAELAVRIASGRTEAGDGGWMELDPRQGGLFLVGDPKQSIYRFRRADVAFFSMVGERMVGSPLLLARNHRSVPGLIAWVNEVFRRWLGPARVEGEVPGIDAQVPAADLTAFRPPQDPARSVGCDRPVHVLGGGRRGSVEEVRREEATDLARAVRTIEAEQWPVGEDGHGARLEDICILIPARTVLPAIEEALDSAGIPYRLESSTLVYSSSEIRELLLVLRAVDDPTDSIAVVGALRSSLFACGDDDLLRFTMAGGSWDYREEPPGHLRDGPVARSSARLHYLHREKWWREPAALVESLIDSSRLLAAALDGPRPREEWRRLRFVADQARWYSDTVGGDLRGYLSWTELLGREGVRVEEAVLPESDYNAVRIMTIHNSKGLEFPIVFLAGLNLGPRPSGGARVLWGPCGPEVSVNSHARSAGFEGLEERDRILDDHEKVRQLYVAATRAEDHLVVSLHHVPGRTSAAARLSEILDEIPDTWTTMDLVENTPPPEPRLDAPAAQHCGDVLTRRSREEWIGKRAQRLLQAQLPRVIAATGVSSLIAGSVGTEADAELDERPPWRRGRAGTAIGRAVHGVLQLVDLASGEGIAELSLSQASAEGVADAARDVERLSRSALESDLIRRAIALPHWREIYVGAPVGERVLEGFVDLLVDGGEGLEVVDYKTDAYRGDEDLERARQRYRPQGAAYALALETAVGRPVARCTFLFLGGRQAIASEIDDLAEAKNEVRAVLERS